MKVLLKRLEAGLRPTVAPHYYHDRPGLRSGVRRSRFLHPARAHLDRVLLPGGRFRRVGRRQVAGVPVSGVAAITSFTVYWVLQRGLPHTLWVAIWNNTARFVVFSFTGWLVAEMTRLTRSLEAQVEERTAQWKKEAEDHKKTATRLTETIERFEQVINNITEVFWLTNVAKTGLLYISPGYERVWGRKCEELYRSPESWLEGVHPRRSCDHLPARPRPPGSRGL